MYHSGVQREIVFTGIGGQGVQLAARTLAEAAVADERRVQLFASYGGMMRGGNSDSFLVISDEAISSPPVVGSAWAAVVMHHEHAAEVWPKLRSDSIAAVNTSVVGSASRPADPRVTVIEVPSLDIATGIGSPMAASLVLLGALVARTGLVSAESLLDSSARVLPSYRAEAAAVNRSALAVGLDLDGTTHPAWETVSS
jgi:Pyruvate/2-oxoacid:ferredoxin oxidoreductase gamma subunit